MTNHRLTFFLPTLRPGGQEIATVNLINELQRLGHTVTLLVAGSHGPLSDDLDPDVELILFHRARPITAFPSLLKYLTTARQPDFYIPVSYAPSVTMLLASKFLRANTPIILSLHTRLDPSLLMPRRLKRIRLTIMRALGRWLFSQAQAISVPSKPVANDISSLVSFPSPRAMPNAVITATFGHDKHHPSGHPWLDNPNETVLLGIGRLAPPKDWLTVLDAFSLLRTTIPAKLVILGDGPDRPKLLQAAAHKGLTASVDFPGYSPRVSSHLTRCSAFILSSIHEAFGNVVIEAAELGVPVVATENVAAAEEFATDPDSVYVVPTRDAHAMALAFHAAIRRGPSTGLPNACRRFHATSAALEWEHLLHQLAHQSGS